MLLVGNMTNVLCGAVSGQAFRRRTMHWADLGRSLEAGNGMEWIGTALLAC